MSWYRVVDSEWQETKRALGRFVARGLGYASWADLVAAHPENQRPVPIYVNPQTGTRFVQITPKIVRWANGETSIGGDRLRLGTRVDVDQLPQWLRNRLEQDQQDN